MNNKSGHHPTKNLVEIQENGLKIIGLATNGTQQQIGTDNNNNVKCNVVSAVSIYPHSSANAEATPTTSFHVKQKVTYENETLTGANALTIYGSNNGTSIDMSNHRHLVIKVRSTATTALSPLQNLRVYYSMDNADFIMGEIIEQNELPNGTTNYQGMIRLENVGFNYVQLLAIGLKASPTAYYINYSRYN
jgi:hypothetical protein